MTRMENSNVSASPKSECVYVSVCIEAVWNGPSCAHYISSPRSYFTSPLLTTPPPAWSFYPAAPRDSRSNNCRVLKPNALCSVLVFSVLVQAHYIHDITLPSHKMDASFWVNTAKATLNSTWNRRIVKNLRMIAIAIASHRMKAGGMRGINALPGQRSFVFKSFWLTLTTKLRAKYTIHTFLL